MAISKIKSDSIDTVAATKLTGTVAEARLATLDATKLTGSIANARIPESAVTQHVVATDLTPIRQDLAMLALYNAVSDNRAAYNLPSSFIDQFEDDTGVTTQTDVDNVDEYFASVYTTAGIDDYTRLMLHMDDTGLTDSATYSASPHTVTKVGSATRSATQSKFGSYSYYADGSGDYLSIAAHAELAYTTGAFTIDFWWRPTTLSGRQTLIAGATDNRWVGLSYMGGSGAKINLEVGGTWSSGSLASPNGTKTNFAADTWYHIAIVREASSSDPVKVYVDGVLDISYAQGSTAITCTDAIQIFGDWGGGNTWNPSGFMDEFRLSIGIARWTSSFTPPTVAYGSTVANATGTLISDTQTASSAATKMSGVILYKDNAGTATLGTDLKIYLSANNGGAWTEAASYGTVTPLFPTGVKMVRLGETTVTSGSSPVIKAVWANQASGSKETQLHGWAMNY